MFIRTRRAFTLIELLIVVAIIAILAAIAVPNFLEAQVRAKVSRAKADMRSLVTALESYRIDFSTYPVPADEDGLIIPLGLATIEGFETRLPFSLTTPIAFIATLPKDPLGAGSGDVDRYHYTTRRYFNAVDGDAMEFEDYFSNLTGLGGDQVQYYILSHGPDGDHDTPDLVENPQGAAIYDPSNGTISSGDVIYWNGVGFRD